MALITDPSGPSGLIIDRQTFPSPTLRKCDLKGFVPSQSRGEENNLLHASGFHGVSGCLVAEKQNKNTSDQALRVCQPQHNAALLVLSQGLT